MRVQRRHSPARAVAAGPGRGLMLLVCNDDFVTGASDVGGLCRRYQPTFFAVQEGKGQHYADQVPPEYGVRQRLTSDATAGVAVGWSTTVATAIGDSVDHPAELGHGWVRIVDGADLLPRGVVWQDVEVTRHSGPARVRLASFHRPPKRDQHLWAAADRGLAAFLAVAPIPVLVGMDSNQEGGPKVLVDLVTAQRSARGAAGASVGARWTGRRIDGVLTQDVVVDGLRDLPKGTSDHRPLLGRVTI